MKKIIALNFVFLLVFASGCNDDFLEKPPLGSLTEGTFPNNSQDAVAATNGIYNTLRIWQFNTGGYPLFDIMSDDSRKGSSPGDGVQISEFNNFSYSATNGNIENWYRTLYLGIRRAHLVLEKVPSITMDEVLQKRLLAEAKFLRAYFYSLLVRGFGDVPMIVSSEIGSGITKATAEEIYQEIIFSDLDYALANLPEKSEYAENELGRATKGSVRALLARLYLYRTDFVNAEKYALEVINSQQYELEVDFSNAFSTTHENGVESIFEIGSLPAEDFNLGGNQLGNTQGIRGNPNRGWGFNRPAYEWITFIGDQDPRMDASVVFLNEIIDGVVILGDGSTPDTTYTDQTKTVIFEIETYSQKVQATGQEIKEGDEIKAGWGYNSRIIRYADVLLMAAEALNENDNPTQALVYLNQVRERARGGNSAILPDIAETDQILLRQIIYDERRRELFMEGLRFWDLVRTDQAVSVLGTNGFKKNKHEFFPIPQSEVDISEGVIEQNPNWK